MGRIIILFPKTKLIKTIFLNILKIKIAGFWKSSPQLYFNAIQVVKPYLVLETTMAVRHPSDTSDIIKLLDELSYSKR